MALELTDKNFEQEVLKSDKAVLVDFWAPWCGPCQMMGPIIEKLAKEIGEKAKVGKLNVEENPNVAEKYSVMSIPAIKIFKGGKIAKDFDSGMQSGAVLKKELESLI